MNKVKNSKFAVVWWCLYDWAQSAFPVVIITFIFGTYFVRSVAEDTVQGTAIWGWAIGASGLVVALFSPLIGSIADHTGRRKKWLATFALIMVVATSMLFYTKPNPSWVIWALICTTIANCCYEFAQVFYNSLMINITSREKFGKVSGIGWACGYIGGLACLVLALFLFIDNPYLGVKDSINIRATTLLVSLWALLFSLPLLLSKIDEPSISISPFIAIKRGAEELIQTIKELKRYMGIIRFLIARLIYVDGLNTLFVFAGIYAAGTFHMTYSQIIVFAITMNIAAGLGAAIFASLDDLIGSKKIIIISLCVIIFNGLILLIIKGILAFWIIATILGFFIGPTQAASRSYMARIAPKELINQMFGIYQLSGRITSFVGPILVASATEHFQSQRMGMSVVFILMLIGLLIMFKVPTIRSN